MPRWVGALREALTAAGLENFDDGDITAIA